MSFVTLASGRRVEISDEAAEQLTTSNGAGKTKASGDGMKTSKLLAHVNGAAITIPDQAAKPFGNFSNFWQVYVAPSPSWSRARMTGSDIGVTLCVKGYLEFYMNGETYKAGTAEKDLPAFDVIHAMNPVYKEVKPLPTFRELFDLVKAWRNETKNR